MMPPGGRAHDGAGGGDERAAMSSGATGWSRLGRIRYFFVDDRWEWSDEVARMHGYRPGAVKPTTQLVVSHTHPEDRQEFAELLRRLRGTGEELRSWHRILDVSGCVRRVAFVCHQLRNESDKLVGGQGFVIDLSGDTQSMRDQLRRQVADIANCHSPIDQAKRMLMMVYDIHEDAAVALLRWRSEQTGVHLQHLSTQIAVDFVGACRDGEMPTRSVSDGLLMTAHLRLAHRE